MARHVAPNTYETSLRALGRVAPDPFTAPPPVQADVLVERHVRQMQRRPIVRGASGRQLRAAADTIQKAGACEPLEVPAERRR